MIEYRNPVLNITRNTIDCEINHPIHGWIPITLDKNSKNSDIDMKGLFEIIEQNESDIQTVEDQINDDPNAKVFVGN